MLEPQPGFEAIRVLGLGDNVVDRYRHTGTMYPGGNALNFSVYAKLLGSDASFMGTFGTDPGAQLVRIVLADLDIPTPSSRIVEGEGGHADVDIRDGNRVFVGSNKGGVARTSPPQLDVDALKLISAQHLVHTSCFSHIDDQLATLHASARLVSYDFSTRWSDASWRARVLPHVDAVVVSLGEGGQDHAGGLLEEFEQSDCHLAIMTMGAAGALLWRSGAAPVQVPTQTTVIVDTLGAGDAFATAVMLTLLGHGWSRTERPATSLLREAGTFGASIAADVCALQGAFGYGAVLEDSQQ